MLSRPSHKVAVSECVNTSADRSDRVSICYTAHCAGIIANPPNLPSTLAHIPSGLKHRKISATVGGSSENTCIHAGTDRTDLTPHYVRANTVQWTSGEIGPLAKVGKRSSVKAWLQRNMEDLSTGGCPYLSLDNCTLNKEVTK